MVDEASVDMQPTLVVTVGLPLSGKSTWAKTQGWPIVNPVVGCPDWRCALVLACQPHGEAMKLLCWLGRHAWDYHDSRDHGYMRTCRRCGRRQIAFRQRFYGRPSWTDLHLPQRPERKSLHPDRDG